MIIHRFHLYWDRARLSGLTDRIVARSQQAVWQRVRERVTSMSPHEAQGYIRARSASVIDREMGIAAAEEPRVDARDWPLIVQAVRQRVVRRALVDAVRLREAQNASRRVA